MCEILYRYGRDLGSVQVDMCVMYVYILCYQAGIIM